MRANKPESCPCPARMSVADVAGTNVHDSKYDVAIAKVTAKASGRNKKPPRPGKSAKGASTRQVAQVATKTGIATSVVPSRAAWAEFLPNP